MSTRTQSAFNPLGLTIAIVAAAAPPLGVQAPSLGRVDNTPSGQYRIVNSGAVAVFLGYGKTAAAAQANAVAPISDTPRQAIALLPGAIEVISFGDGTFFSGRAASSVTLYITPGVGL